MKINITSKFEGEGKGGWRVYKFETCVWKSHVTCEATGSSWRMRITNDLH